MKLISNTDTKNHLTEISKDLNIAGEAIICIAFLKLSGLNYLIESLNRIKKETIFYIGIDFYLTEPSALRKLYESGFKLFITQLTDSTFHPKIYYLKNDNDVTVFIGSANLTNGGLTTNLEASVKLKTHKESNFDIELNQLFKGFAENSILVDNLELIANYEKKYLIYRNKHKIADDEFNDEVKKLEKKRRNIKNRKKGEGAKLQEDDFIARLIEIYEYKTACLERGEQKWLPSQTDPDPKVADLGNWLNDHIEWIKNHYRDGVRLDVAKEREKELLDLGIYIGGIRQSYFEHSAKEYLEMRKKFPFENPKGAERKPYAHILKWETENRSRFEKFPEWRQKRLKELKIVE